MLFWVARRYAWASSCNLWVAAICNSNVIRRYTNVFTWIYSNRERISLYMKAFNIYSIDGIARNSFNRQSIRHLHGHFKWNHHHHNSVSLKISWSNCVAATAVAILFIAFHCFTFSLLFFHFIPYGKYWKEKKKYTIHRA